MTLTQATYSRIQQISNSNNLTITGLCDKAGVAQSTVWNLASNKTKSPNSLLILRICRSVNMTLAEFYNDPMFLNLDDE